MSSSTLQESPGESPLEDECCFHLPTEIWTQIFQHLYKSDFIKVRLVCRHWKAISDGSPALVKKLRVRFPHCITMDENYCPEDFPPAIRASMRYTNITAPLDTWWSSLGSRLLYLELTGCVFSPDTFIWMLQRTPNLKRLKLSGYSQPCGTNPEVCFRLESMEELSLEGQGFSVYCDIFRQVFPRLKVLELDYVVFDEDEEQQILRFVSAIQNTLQRLCLYGTDFLLDEVPNLEQLRLKYVSVTKFERESPLVEFCRRQPTIEHLDLGITTSISNMALTAIARFLPGLRSLTANLHQEVPLFLATMTSLEHLYLYFAERPAVDFGACACPRLKTFRLNYAKPNSSLCNFLQTSRYLHSVTLEYCIFDSWTPVFAMLDQLKNMQRLHLEHVHAETQENNFPESSSPHLRHLELIALEMSTDMMTTLFRQCSQLRSIHLSGPNIGDDVVRALFQSLPRLERLHLLYGCSITDNAASHIVEQGRQLRHVVLDECEQVSWYFRKQVTRAFPDGREPQWELTESAFENLFGLVD